MGFFNDPKPDENEEVENKPEESQSFKIGEDEYTQQELEELVGLGKLGREAEEKYNTKLDRVWPEYGRSQTELKKAQDRISELESKLEESPQDPVIQQSVADAKEAARNLGIVLEDDFEQTLSKNFRKFYIQEREAERLLDQLDGLESKIGVEEGDTRPKFNKTKVLQHMADNGFKDPVKAYEDLYRSQTDEWRAMKLLEAKKPGLVTQEQGGATAKVPESPKVTMDNLRAMLGEVMQQ